MGDALTLPFATHSFAFFRNPPLVVSAASGRMGSVAAIRSTAAFCLWVPLPQVGIGPLLPFTILESCCGAARQTGLSLQPRNMMLGEFTVCGQSVSSQRLRQWLLSRPFNKLWFLEHRQCAFFGSGNVSAIRVLLSDT
jgi:hypothetical protein